MEQFEVGLAILDQATGRMEDEHGTEGETEEEDVHVDLGREVSEEDQEATEEGAVLRVFIQHQDPVVQDYGGRTQEAWGSTVQGTVQ